MKHEDFQWRWEEGIVDEREEHIELHHANAARPPHEEWRPIGRISKPRDHVFAVEWLITENSPSDQAVLADARREVTFYLVEKKEANPWGYACYHCNTGANMYSNIRWLYRSARKAGGRRIDIEHHEK